jgi:transcription elongation factor GreA
MRIPKRNPGKYAPGPADFHLTHTAIGRLREELKRLEEQARPRAVEELRRTREMGDLSENAAYSAAKARLLGMDQRILEIKERLKRAVPISHGAGPGGTIRIGATVTVEIDGRVRTYDIVGSQEADPSGGAISYLSPLGKALMGRRAGETIEIEANGRRIEYRIVEVR